MNNKKYKYNHIGIPTTKKLKNEEYLAKYDMYHSGYQENEFNIEWMRYGEKCPLPDIVKKLPHVAFEVDDVCEAINPNKHTEALTSRPLLLHAVGKLTTHANQTMLVISSTHGEAKHIHQRLAKLSHFFKKLQSNAEQLTSIERWHRILSVAFVKYLKGHILKPPDLIAQTC